MDPDGKFDICDFYIPDFCSLIKATENKIAVPLGGGLSSSQKDISKIQSLLTFGFSQGPNIGSFVSIFDSDFSMSTVMSLTEPFLGMIFENAGRYLSFYDLANIIAKDPDISSKNYTKSQEDFLVKCVIEQAFIKDYSDALNKKGILNTKIKNGSFIMNLEIHDVPLFSDILIDTANEVKSSKHLYEGIEINY